MRGKFLPADVYILLVFEDLLILLSLAENSRQEQQHRKFHNLIKGEWLEAEPSVVWPKGQQAWITKIT